MYIIQEIMISWIWITSAGPRYGFDASVDFIHFTISTERRDDIAEVRHRTVHQQSAFQLFRDAIEGDRAESQFHQSQSTPIYPRITIIILQLIQFLKYASKAMDTVIKEDMKLEATHQVIDYWIIPLSDWLFISVVKICETIKQYALDNNFNFRSTVLKPLMNIELEDLSLADTATKGGNKKSLMSRKQKKNEKKNKKHTQEIEQISAKESLSLKYNKVNFMWQTYGAFMG